MNGGFYMKNKKDYFLTKLKNVEHKIIRWNKIMKENRGKELSKKLKRLFLLPKFYFYYTLLIKYKLFQKKAWVNLFFDRKIYIQIEDIYNLILFLYKAPDFLDLKVIKFLLEKFKENDIFYDVGANYGFYTALASEFCLEVHSFEPNPIIFSCLKESFKDSKNVFLNQVALSDKNGEADLLLAGASSSIIEEVKIFLKKMNFKKVYQVKTTTLKDYLLKNKPPTIIKIDVEGAEEKVIYGGIDFFKENNSIVIMEVVLSDNFGKSRRELSKNAVDLLINCGYKMYFVDENGQIYKTKYEEHIYKCDYDNFILMK
jgi:FkbM family methyltransferase